MQKLTEMREALVSVNVFYQKVEGGENDSGKWKTIIMMADTRFAMLPKLLVYS